MPYGANFDFDCRGFWSTAQLFHGERHEWNERHVFRRSHEHGCPRIEARVGDTVRIRFKNSLPEPTTIHWHGLRVPAAMDGTAVAQAPVPPGGEFTYEFIVPDAGTFWYHPHVRSNEQVERGLYGAFIVRGDNEPTTTTDRAVVLDDLLVDPSTWQIEPFDVMQEAMVGREGNL
ncbi:MAG TPA: multicopper oxidase domain-containing protein, partial [Polyangiaceae bacterium]